MNIHIFSFVCSRPSANLSVISLLYTLLSWCYAQLCFPKVFLFLACLPHVFCGKRNFNGVLILDNSHLRGYTPTHTTWAQHWYSILGIQQRFMQLKLFLKLLAAAQTTVRTMMNFENSKYFQWNTWLLRNFPEIFYFNFFFNVLQFKIFAIYLTNLG